MNETGIQFRGCIQLFKYLPIYSKRSSILKSYFIRLNNIDNTKDKHTYYRTQRSRVRFVGKKATHSCESYVHVLRRFRRGMSCRKLNADESF